MNTKMSTKKVKTPRQNTATAGCSPPLDREDEDDDVIRNPRQEPGHARTPPWINNRSHATGKPFQQDNHQWNVKKVKSTK